MLRGLSAYSRALSFIAKHNLWQYFLWPALISALVLAVGIGIVSSTTDWLFQGLMTLIAPETWLPEWASWVADVIYWVLWIVLRVLLYFALAFVGGTVVLTLMAPIFSILSERVAVLNGSSELPFSFSRFLSDTARAAGLAIKNGTIQLLLTLACFIVGFIPVIGLAAPFLLFAVNSYYYGFNFIDYSLERQHIGTAESQRWVWQHRSTALGLGLPFALWLLIPFLGSLFAGFVAIVSCVAATLEVENRLIKTDSPTTG